MYRRSRPVREYIADYLLTVHRTPSEAEIVAFENVWAPHDHALSFPRPRVQKALSSFGADGIRLGLLSNAHEREIRGWALSPLCSQFDEATFSCQVGHVKPEHAAYHHLLNSLGVQAKDAIFVGDGGSEELRGAREVGFGAVVFMRGLLKELRLREAEFGELAASADAVVDEICEIRELYSVDAG